MAEESIRCSGTVRWFNNQKGFGFISPHDGGEDLFVHQSTIKSEGFRTLLEGQIVEFSITVDNDRTKAVDVTGPDGSSLYEGRKDGYSGGRDGLGSRNNSGGGVYGSSNGYRGSGRNNGGGGGGGGCYSCGESGHMARDCRRQGNGGGGGGGGGNGGGSACFNCGANGHLARDCNSGAGGGGSACYTCGGHGHLARDCPSDGGGFNRYGRGRGGRDGGSSCYNCGQQGHFARECPNNAS